VDINQPTTLGLRPRLLLGAKMTKENAKAIGEAIGFSLCALMFYLLSWSLLRALASTAPYFLTK